MDEKTRQLVLDTLEIAHAAAHRSVQADLDGLPPEGRQPIEEAIEEFRTCVHNQAAGTLQPAAAAERIRALIYGHPVAQAVQVMERYARTLNDLLCASRDLLTSTGKRRDN
jgi:hypothetical protein